MIQQSLPHLLFPTNKQPVNGRKLRGGYYTPSELANYLTYWGVRENTQRILEPSCGDGNFIQALLQQLPALPHRTSPHIVAIELEAVELQKAQNRATQFNKNGTQLEWLCQDFFVAYHQLKQGGKFDLVIGNPPFIRFQHFSDDSRRTAFHHLKAAGYHPTKLANSWVAFVQLSIELLRENGRLAMVVPAELLQVKYAHELRDRLATHFEHIIIVGFRKLVFPEIQQEVVLILAEGKREANGHTSDIHTIEFSNATELLDLHALNKAISHTPAKHTRTGMKWTSLFLDEITFAALDEAEMAVGLTPLGQLAQVDVGIVTGRNNFFILTESQKNEFGMAEWTVPVIGKTAILKSPTFQQIDFQTYKDNYPAFLLNLTGVDSQKFPQKLKNYLQLGEQQNIHQGYKCRIRKRWFDVPSISIPDAFLFRQIHRYPLLVINEANVTSTDTIHRVWLKPHTNAKQLAATFFNSLTVAWAEVCGRSYGGGVLELEPREAEELPIPYQINFEIDSEKVDALLRSGCVYEALDYVDEITLKNHLGFDTLMIKRIRTAWEQLRDRRINRH